MDTSMIGSLVFVSALTLAGLRFRTMRIAGTLLVGGLLCCSLTQLNQVVGPALENTLSKLPTHEQTVGVAGVVAEVVGSTGQMLLAPVVVLAIWAASGDRWVRKSAR